MAHGILHGWKHTWRHVARHLSLLYSDKLIVAILGQSNANGKADIDDVTITQSVYAAQSTVPLDQQIALGPVDPLVFTQYTLEGVKPRTDNAVQNMGFELSIARALETAYPGRFALSKSGVGSAGLNDHYRVDQTYPAVNPPNLHTKTIQWLQGTEGRLGGRLSCIVWVQGETDALDATDAAAYEVNLTNLIAAWRAIWPNIPVIIHRLCNNHAYAQKAVVRTAQQNVDTNVAFTTLIDTDTLTLQGDGDHYTADSYITGGITDADAIMTALNVPAARWSSSVGVGTRDATFTNTSINAASYLWNFGDGTTSTATNPVHTYAANGTYQVTLTATSASGKISTKTVDVLAAIATGFWSVDATSGKGIPQTNAEWAALLSAHSQPSPTAPLRGVQVPSDFFKMQEAAGNPVGSGTAALTLTANATPLYQQAVAGWTSKALGTTDATANQRFRSLETALPNLSTESMLVLCYGAIANNPAATRGFIGMGLASQAEMRIVTSGGTTGLARLIAGGNTATSALEMGTGVRPYVMVVNRTASTQALYDDRQKLAPAFGSGQAGEGLSFGTTTGVTTPATSFFLYSATWFLDAAELTDQQIRDLLEALGWTITGYGS